MIMRLMACVTAGLLVCFAQDSKSERFKAPKIWDEKELADWGLPVAGINQRPHHYTEKEYYAAPVTNLRSYPVYHPDREPKGYMEWLKKQGAQSLIEDGKARTKEEWIKEGERVWEQMDLHVARTADPRALELIRDRQAIAREERHTKEGYLYDLRWVVESGGQVKLSVRECSACHNRVLADGSVVVGGQGNFPDVPAGELANILFADLPGPVSPGAKPPSAGEAAYAAVGVRWIKDDIHGRMKTMKDEEAQALVDADVPGTFARVNGSPYWTSKIPPLWETRHHRYLDHTGTHRNRGPADIARYAALVTTADDGSIGPHRFLSDYQRRIRVRYPDDALFALGMYISYGLKAPENPNKPSALSQAGEKVFGRAACLACHTPPAYTSGALMPVDGFTPPDSPVTKSLNILRSMRLGADPGVALKTRKGTGYYRVPSLRNVWARPLIEHSGSIASLEDWFDRKRLRPDYVPSGWKGPGVKTRAVPGHEFGMDLSAEDKRALIAFLRTL
jgi:mono/diheme cytochrome c family protein